MNNRREASNDGQWTTDRSRWSTNDSDGPSSTVGRLSSVVSRRSSIVGRLSSILALWALLLGARTLYTAQPTFAARLNAIWDEDMSDLTEWGTHNATFTPNNNGTATLAPTAPATVGKAWTFVDAYNVELHKTLLVNITALQGVVKVAVSGDSDFAYQELQTMTAQGVYTAPLDTWQTTPYSGSLFIQLVVEGANAAATFEELTICTDACQSNAFSHSLLVGGLQAPTDVTMAPNGDLYVAEKAGKVWLVRAGQQSKTPVLDITREVHSYVDRGLLGITLHPDFPQTPYLYLLYVVDQTQGSPNSDNEDQRTFGRLARYSTRADGTLDPTSRKILLGNSAADGLIHCGPSHSVGAVRFGPDGMLYLSSGEGAQGEFDIGGDAACAQLFGAARDIGALRALNLNNPAGKILRLDPETGAGLPDNPFFTGDGQNVQSKIWALGLRNPFRFIVTAHGAYIGDVGKDDWEEINLAHGGENFQWPCYQGNHPHRLYFDNPASVMTCTAPYIGTPTPPLLAWNHREAGATGFIGSAIAGLALYNGAAFPAHYQGALFFADYAKEWIKVAQLNTAGQIVSIEDFGYVSTLVDLEVDPATGDLVYVALETGQVRRIHYGDQKQIIVAKAAAQPASGKAPLRVQLRSDGSYHTEGKVVGLHWSFGDGSPGSSAPNPVHEYKVSGIFTATLVLIDTQGNVATDTVAIDAHNQPPQVSILKPTNTTFQHGDLLNFEASGTDPEDGAAAIQWEIQQIHNDHIHLVCTADKAAFSCQTSADHQQAGEHLSYRALATARDQGGLTAQAQLALLPRTATANQSPVAALTMTPQACRAPYIVRFDADGSSDADQDLVSYAWDFGNGFSSSASATTHLYSRPGVYLVTLMVRDPFQATGVATKTLTIPPSGTVFHFDDDFASLPADWRDASDNSEFRAAFTQIVRGTAELRLPAQEVWGKTLSPVFTNVDVCQPLILQVVVRSISAGASLSLGIQEELAPYAHYTLRAAIQQPGVISLDVGETLRWVGSHTFSLELILEGAAGAPKTAEIDMVTLGARYWLYLPVISSTLLL